MLYYLISQPPRFTFMINISILMLRWSMLEYQCEASATFFKDINLRDLRISNNNNKLNQVCNSIVPRVPNVTGKKTVIFTLQHIASKQYIYVSAVFDSIFSEIPTYIITCLPNENTH